MFTRSIYATDGSTGSLPKAPPVGDSEPDR
jgi:hypothetical protein